MTRLVRENGGGQRRWALHLLSLEANILGSLPDQVEALLGRPDRNRRVIDRLFPPSYADAEEEARNRQLLGDSLLQERRELLDDVRDELARATPEQGGVVLHLGEPSMDLLMRFINDVRLVLATDLGIERDMADEAPDPADPEAPKYALLEYLGGVEAIFVDALSREP